MFILFRGLVQSLDGNSKRIPFFTILTELRSLQRKLGYLLLYYLHAVEISGNHEKLYSYVSMFFANFSLETKTSKHKNRRFRVTLKNNFFFYLYSEIFNHFELC